MILSFHRDNRLHECRECDRNATAHVAEVPDPGYRCSKHLQPFIDRINAGKVGRTIKVD